jgi:hypothetical protein
MKRFLLPTLLILALSLAACSATTSTVPSNPQPAPISTASSSPSNDSATRTDEQGAVVVEVTPLNLGTPTDTLEFDIAMNTHSVDLSMNLTTISTLITDTGITLQAITWDAPNGGGHHVDGKLIFPATKDGKSILEGATKLTLTILNLDAPSRVFEWNLK